LFVFFLYQLVVNKGGHTALTDFADFFSRNVTEIHRESSQQTLFGKQLGFGCVTVT